MLYFVVVRVHRLTAGNKDFTSHFPLESALVPGNLNKDGETVNLYTTTRCCYITLKSPLLSYTTENANMHKSQIVVLK